MMNVLWIMDQNFVKAHALCCIFKFSPCTVRLISCSGRSDLQDWPKLAAMALKNRPGAYLERRVALPERRFAAVSQHRRYKRTPGIKLGCGEAAESSEWGQITAQFEVWWAAQFKTEVVLPNVTRQQHDTLLIFSTWAETLITCGDGFSNAFCIFVYNNNKKKKPASKSVWSFFVFVFVFFLPTLGLRRII